MDLSGLFCGDKKAAHHLSCMCWTYFAAPPISVFSHSEILNMRGCCGKGVGEARHRVSGRLEVLASLGCHLFSSQPATLNSSGSFLEFSVKGSLPDPLIPYPP